MSEDLDKVLDAGHDGIGWLAQTGWVPLGYFADADKTARTFPVIDGVRYSVPGDRARLLPDGEIELLGRDSVTINSGGEKIFAEEVERAIAGHPSVHDVVVVGRASERWGQEVVALVELSDGQTGDRRRHRDPRRPARRPLQAARRTCCSSTPSSAARRARPTTAGPRPRCRTPAPEHAAGISRHRSGRPTPCTTTRPRGFPGASDVRMRCPAGRPGHPVLRRRLRRPCAAWRPRR